MPVALTAVGIQSVEMSLVETVSRERKTDLKSIMESDGGFGAAATIDPINEFSIKGRGDVPEALVLGMDVDLELNEVTGSGTTIIESLKEGQKNDDFPDWEVSGKNFPGAD